MTARRATVRVTPSILITWRANSTMCLKPRDSGRWKALRRAGAAELCLSRGHRWWI